MRAPTRCGREDRRRSCRLQVACREVNAMLAECGGGPDQRLHPLRGQRRREPGCCERPRSGPLRWRKIQLGGEVLSQSGQQGIPLVRTTRRWLVTKQLGLFVARFPAVLLKKLPNVLPSDLLVLLATQAFSEICHCHRPVRHDHPPPTWFVLVRYVRSYESCCLGQTGSSTRLYRQAKTHPREISRALNLLQRSEKARNVSSGSRSTRPVLTMSP